MAGCRGPRLSLRRGPLRHSLASTRTFALAEQSAVIDIAVEITNETFAAVGEHLLDKDGIAETVHDGPFRVGMRSAGVNWTRATENRSGDATRSALREQRVRVQQTSVPNARAPPRMAGIRSFDMASPPLRSGLRVKP